MGPHIIRNRSVEGLRIPQYNRDHFIGFLLEEVKQSTQFLDDRRTTFFRGQETETTNLKPLENTSKRKKANFSL